MVYYLVLPSDDHFFIFITKKIINILSCDHLMHIHQLQACLYYIRASADKILTDNAHCVVPQHKNAVLTHKVS